jgi:DNA-binding transcriptional ArsR family regulator
MVLEVTGSGESGRLDRAFNALADPTRRAILARLAEGEASVAELAEPFDMSVRAVSKHISVLERAGMVSRGRDAQRRPSKIVAAPLHDAYAWLKAYSRLWDDRLDRIETLLAKTKEGSHGSRR